MQLRNEDILKLTNKEREREDIMAVKADYVRQVFKGLESGDGAEFFAHVADDVD